MSLLLAAPAAWAQSPPMAFEHLSLEQGLSQTTVLCIFQDSRGFMWFGTEDGLNRYDGLSFRTYKYDPADSSSLPNSMVWAIVEDRRGDLWIGTEGGGVARWDHRRDRFQRVTPSSGGSGPMSMRVRSLLLDPDGALWIGTKETGLSRLEPGSGAIQTYRHDPNDPASLSHDAVFAILADGSGHLWVGTDGGLNRFDRATGKFQRYLNDPANPASLGDNRVRSLRLDREGRLWIGTYGGLNRLEPAEGRFRRYKHDAADAASLSHDRVRSILEDGAGRLWIGTDGGLDLMDRARTAFRHYRHDPTDPGTLWDDNVMSLHQDRGGVLWVGTRNAGIHKWYQGTWSFGHQTRVASNPGGLTDKTVTSFAEDPTGRIWIGTFGGLHSMDRTSGQIRPYTASTPGLSTRVMALSSDPEGALWIGTMDAGLSRMDPSTGALRTFRNDARDPGSLSSDAVMAITVDGLGDLWVGTHGGGLNRLDAGAGTFTRYRHDPADPASVGADIVTAMAPEGPGSLWLGTDGAGLNLLDRASGKFLRFMHDPEDPRSLGANTIFSLYLDPAGQLWVGTRGAGLALLESRSGSSASFRHFTQRDGLANDVVYGILPDGDGYLWLSTNNGLSRFDPRSRSFKNYDVAQGLQSNEFNFGAHYRSASGELFFGGVNGLNAFHPRRLAANNHAPPVVLTSFLKSNKPVDLGALWEMSAIDLGYRDEVVTFEFAALDFAAPQRNRYSYRLDGFDPEWIDLGNLHRVTYTNLRPGRYRLRVRASNSDGVWNEAGLDLPLRVEAAPWQRWWAYLIYGLGLGSALVAFVRGQQARVKREEDYSRRLEDEVQRRTVELAARNSDLEEVNRKLAEASLTDSLTGLRNRRFLFEHVSKDADLVRRRYMALKQGDEARTFDLSFVMIDLDCFKSINDTCGHTAGDLVLLGVRSVLEKTCRASDVLIRWGGDEFLLVGRDNDPEQVSVLAERIRSEIESTTFEIGEGRVARTTCSVGYACYPFLREEPELFGWEEMLSLADAALYAAKQKRNAWVGYLSTQQPPPAELTRTGRLDPDRLLEEGALRAVSSDPELERERGESGPSEQRRPRGAPGAPAALVPGLRPIV
ncbi:MAG TPA: two-component regulator propeller domain-containing protein, partial [Vicinamibacteria bacterium]